MNWHFFWTMHLHQYIDAITTCGCLGFAIHWARRRRWVLAVLQVYIAFLPRLLP